MLARHHYPSRTEARTSSIMITSLVAAPPVVRSRNKSELPTRRRLAIKQAGDGHPRDLDDSDICVTNIISLGVIKGLRMKIVEVLKRVIGNSDKSVELSRALNDKLDQLIAGSDNQQRLLAEKLDQLVAGSGNEQRLLKREAQRTH